MTILLPLIAVTILGIFCIIAQIVYSKGYNDGYNKGKDYLIQTGFPIPPINEYPLLELEMDETRERLYQVGYFTSPKITPNQPTEQQYNQLKLEKLQQIGYIIP